jgi:hypothetical protein
MESGDPNVESTRELSSLKKGDIVVLTLRPAFLSSPAEEKTARITLKLSNSFTVEHRRFSITSGKELVRVDAGKWRLVDDGAFISVPAEEQIERLPDPDGNYTEAQILRRREESVALLLDRLKEYLDPKSPEISKRILGIQFLVLDKERQELLGEVYSDAIERLKAENEDLRSRLRMLSTMLDEASRLAEAP